MHKIGFMRSQAARQQGLLAGAFLVVFSCAVGLGVASRQLTHAIDPDLVEHRASTNRLNQMTPDPDTETPPTETRQGVAMERQPAPKYSCTSLAASPTNNKGNAYSFRAAISTANGAQLHKLVYNFGDGTTRVIESSQNVSASHTYTKAGVYSIKVTSYFKLTQGKTVSTQDLMCTAALSVPATAFKDTPPATPKSPPSAAAPDTSRQRVPEVTDETPPPQPHSVIASAAPTPKKSESPAPKAQPKVEELPKAGSEGAIMWFIGTVCAATMLHMLYKQRGAPL